MNIEYVKHYSSALDRDMEFKVYGDGRGRPVLFVPCQGGRFFDFEGFKMIDHWAKWIEEGRCTVYAVDSIDNEAWAAKGQDERHRIEMHEKWYHYVVDELVPLIWSMSQGKILTFGCSMGATHAVNLFFRRPDIFGGVFAISGLYDNSEFFDNYVDDLVYNNCPCLYLANLPADHFYRGLYDESDILIVCGQGAWEEPLLASTRWLDTVCAEQGINARFEYWGLDVNHDWPWWYKMVEYYVPQLL